MEPVNQTVSTEQNLEEMFQKLEGILEMLDKGEVSLEETFALYREGMTLLEQCHQKIDTVEKKMKCISKEGETYDF